MRETGLGMAAALAAAVWAAASAPVAAQAIRLAPASPQPEAAALKPGLAVRYAYPRDVKSLEQAESWRGRDQGAGPPLIGFDYPDTEPGDKVMTSYSSERVVAFIDGYMRFDAPGAYMLEFRNNDGLRVEIGGAEVYDYDGRHPCETGGQVTVEAPEAGWYPVSAVYFQRLQTSCLLLRWRPPGGAEDWAPDGIFAYEGK